MAETFLKGQQAFSEDGWVRANETWTYASASTITVPSGAASKYGVEDRIKLTQATVKYFIVTVVADTVLTVYGGTDYTVANAAISANYYSRAENPFGFPAIPRCSVWGGQLNIANNSTVTVALDNENFDIGSNFDHVTTFKFTAPIIASSKSEKEISIRKIFRSTSSLVSPMYTVFESVS